MGGQSGAGTSLLKPWKEQSFWLIAAFFLLLQLPFLNRPLHYDEPNFATLTQGAHADFWRPHAISINWQGSTERAFNVLSNPPGIAWVQQPVLEQPVWVQRLWLGLWVFPGLLGAWWLGLRLLGSSLQGAILLYSSPIVLVSTTALLPDAPLFALTLLGIGGWLEAQSSGQRRWPWALVLGFASWFRYSALPLPLVLGAAALANRRSPWPALVGFIPILLLCLHDLHAYGALHLVAMGQFQAVAETPEDLYHKLVAALAMLGGAVALPGRGFGKWGLVGAVVGGVLALPWGIAGVCFAAAGGAALGGVLKHRRWLGLWAFGGLLVLVALRFVATRYWLPFAVPFLVAGGVTPLKVGASLLLGLLLLKDEAESAAAVRELARAVDQAAEGEKRGFTGHWGWQYALEKRGWVALEEDGLVAPGWLVAIPKEAWPQGVEMPSCTVIFESTTPARSPYLPHSYLPDANLHSSQVMGEPPKRTVLPWWFGTAPVEQARLCRVEE